MLKKHPQTLSTASLGFGSRRLEEEVITRYKKISLCELCFEFCVTRMCKIDGVDDSLRRGFREIRRGNEKWMSFERIFEKLKALRGSWNWKKYSTGGEPHALISAIIDDETIAVLRKEFPAEGTTNEKLQAIFDTSKFVEGEDINDVVKMIIILLAAIKAPDVKKIMWEDFLKGEPLATQYLNRCADHIGIDKVKERLNTGKDKDRPYRRLIKFEAKNIDLGKYKNFFTVIDESRAIESLSFMLLLRTLDEAMGENASNSIGLISESYNKAFAWLADKKRRKS